MALFGLDENAVPDDALALLSRFLGGLGNEYVWAKSDDTGIVGYVNSPDPSASPPAESDGYTYTALGRLGAKVQIATGSYIGTGTYGSANPCRLTFDFSPKVVYIYSSDLSPYAEPNRGYWGTCDMKTTVTPFFNTLTSIYTTWRRGSELESRILNYTIDGNTFTWVMADMSGTGTSGGPAAAAGAQLNTSNKVYYYFAIG